MKNEAAWISGHLSSWLSHLDEMVFFDGNSTDGTLEIIRGFMAEDKDGHKIKLFTDRDPANLKEDYERVFNDCLRSLSTTLAAFIHPDMILSSGDTNRIRAMGNSPVALSSKMRSFAGEPDGPLLEIVGRAEVWKNIYRLRNPDLGAHYHGFYGAVAEDVYFSAITGEQHAHFGGNLKEYPYAVEDSGLEILHFSDVRTRERRIDRMVKCGISQGVTAEKSLDVAVRHPRVTLEDGHGFSFIPAEYPAEFLDAKRKYQHLEKHAAHV